MHKGLIVKIMAKELKDAGLYKAKGLVRRLPKPGVAEIVVFESEAVVQVKCFFLASNCVHFTAASI